MSLQIVTVKKIKKKRNRRYYTSDRLFHMLLIYLDTIIVCAHAGTIL